MLKFDAVIEDSGKGGAWIKIPFDVESVFGKKRVRVKATFDGEPYHGSLVRMGTPYHILGIRKDIQSKIGKTVGDRVRVTVQEDTEPRVVQVPEDFRKALAQHPAAAAFFDQLSYTHQKEYVNWINDAKKEETRKNRIAKALEMMRTGKKGR